MTKRLIRVALLGLLTTGMGVPLVANAAPLTFNFTVDGGISGPLAGVSSSGYFTIDDAIIPEFGGDVIGGSLFQDFGFTWNGVSYNASTVNSSYLSFDFFGTLLGWGFGSDCPNTDQVGCQAFSGQNSWFIDYTSFVYGLPQVRDQYYEGTANVTRRQANVDVPEPGTLALLALGLAATWFGSRRRVGAGRNFAAA
jgi:hypothetical protein